MVRRVKERHRSCPRLFDATNPLPFPGDGCGGVDDNGDGDDDARGRSPLPALIALTTLQL